MAGGEQAFWLDSLAGLGQFGGPLGAEQQPGRQSGDGNHGGPVQHPGQGGGVLAIADRMWAPPR